MIFVTYNIRLGRQRGIDPVVSLLEALEPDVLALQEVGANWRAGPAGHPTRRIAQQIGLQHAEFVPAIVEPGGTRYGQALLSRWPLRNVEIHALTAVRDEPRRAVTADVVAPGEPLRVLATHVSHVEDDRAGQGRELLDLSRSCAPGRRPFVIMGDLNEPASAPALWLQELFDEFSAARRRAPEPTFENPSPEERIDYLLVSGAEWEEAGVPEVPDLSDHRPVWARLAGEHAAHH